MNQKELFFDFESKYGLFNLKDKYGKNPWDAVRYFVYTHKIVSKQSCSPILASRKIRSITIRDFIRLIKGIFYFFTHIRPDYIFIICSRDRINNITFDKISSGLVDQIDKSRVFFIETCPLTTDNILFPNICPHTFYSLFNKLAVKRYDFSNIVCLLHKNFPGIEICEKELDDEYRRFVIQYKYFKFLFKLLRPQQVFLVQNGIHKGLFAAAKELGVESLEFQHGQISYNHMAYSYPKNIENLENMIYQPDKLLLFGDFWAGNRCYPGVENVVIGNNYYANNVEMTETLGSKRIIVISNDIEGAILSELVRKIIQIDPEFFFYFKLHPNQLREKQHYYESFKQDKNVEVVFDEYTINELLVKSEAILLIQSTTELEALQAGRKVFILKEGAYDVMDFVFDEDGVFLIDDADSFVDCYNTNKFKRLLPRKDFFSKFDKEMAESVIKKRG